MLITNGTIITWEKPNRVLPAHALLIKDQKIVEVSPEAELVKKYPLEERYDARGQFIMPGNICAHTHFYGAYSRGLAIPGSAPADFPEILKKLWWPLDRALSFESVRYSTLVCLMDAIHHGTTTLFDHHASPEAILTSLDIIADAVNQSGLRVSLCYEVTDRNGEDGALKGIQENVRFIQALRTTNIAQNRISAMFGLHASLTLSEKTLEKCREAVPEGFGFHVHVAEHIVDEYDSLAKSGMRVVDRLYRHGILGPESLIVHAVNVDAHEIELLAETNTWVSHQPRSNMNNAVGLPPVESMLRMGIRVCLGNDGFSNAMWEEWKAAYLAHKLWHHDPRRMNGMDITEMAIYNNADLASHFFKDIGPIGKITTGAQADLIVVDYKPYTPVTEGNLPWHILFGFHESMVTSTIVAGKFLMKNRLLLTLDEDRIYDEAMKLAPDVWNRYNKQM